MAVPLDGDDAFQPNPCKGKIVEAPFYAIPVFHGDLGTKGGLVTDKDARVLREDGSVIRGLYAAGNSSASVMGPTYPGAGGTIGPALSGVEAAVYLIHGMQAGADYDVREAEAAKAFREAAAEAGLRRIVYLGGVAPEGVPSKHLWSRIRTGEILREGPVSAIELRAGMVIGHGSLSWQIVRDLAARLPVMILPRWLRSRSQPIAIDDVVFAIRTGLRYPPRNRFASTSPAPRCSAVRTSCGASRSSSASGR